MGLRTAPQYDVLQLDAYQSSGKLKAQDESMRKTTACRQDKTKPAQTHHGHSKMRRWGDKTFFTRYPKDLKAGTR